MSPTINDLVSRCRTAQAAWAGVPISDRLAIVRRLRLSVAANAERICLTATQDIGRPANDVLATDIIPTADALRFLERNAKRVLGPRLIEGSDRPWWLFGERETIYRRAHGIVGVIGTWNYPVLLNAITIAQALAAGNGVVWKPSELVPTVAECLHALYLESGIPADLFVRLPAGRDVGAQLIEADVDHVVFTGSAAVGRKVAARLGERLISSTMELSGCDAMFVLDDADATLAARAAWYGMTLNVGQTCLAVRRAFVQRKKCDEFLAVLRPIAAGRRAEPLVLFSQVEQAQRLVREAVAAGAALLADDDLPLAADDPPRFEPTVVVNATPEMAICKEASFAPILAIIPFDDDDQAVAMSETCTYGLGASIFTSNRNHAVQLARRIRAGSIAVNDVIVGTAHPAIGFGGVRHSGWGVTRGEEGLKSMTVPQVVTVRKGRFRLHFHGDDPAFAELTAGLLAWSHAPNARSRWRGLMKLARGFRKLLY